MKIVSSRLIMEQISEDDWDLFYQLHTNEKVIKLCYDKPRISEIKSKFMSRLVPWSKNSSHWLCLAIVDSCTGNKIGVTGFRVRDKNAEVGYLLLPEYHGFGYATESLVALIDYSKMQLGICNFSAVVTDGNIASEKVLTKTGFVLDRVQSDSHMVGGRLYDDIFYKYS